MAEEPNMASVQIDREAILGAHFLLRHLGPPELRRIASATVLARHPAQATIFQKGDQSASLMAVVRGRVKICIYSAEGKELVLNIIDRGGVFGEIALLDGRSRTADAVALEETDLLVLERNKLLPILAEHPEITTRLIGVLCERLRQTSEHLEDATLREAPSRLARGLLRLANTFWQKEPDGIRLDIKLSQQQLGNLIGVSRESINKHIVDWTRAGHLATRNGFIVIRDRDTLMEIAAAEI
jgi:CRP/FNR family transcriptional regulator, cyclic AMP receptor protein